MAKKATISLFSSIRKIIDDTRKDIYRTTNYKMVTAYYFIGKLIVENEQQGNEKAGYAASTLQILSDQLNEIYTRGFSVDNLENMRRFYLAYAISETTSRKSKQVQQGFQGKGSKKNDSSISEMISRKLPESTPVFNLSFSHYVFLSRIETLPGRKFYEIETTSENWSLEELKRQYNASLYERLVLSRNKKKVKALSKEGHVIAKAADAIKDPYVLEFLGLKQQAMYSENDLEQALIDKLESFLSELGKGFLFVGRQYRITIEEDHHHIDLVFYHRILRCFVLLDLKLGDLKADDLGQMQLYVGYFDEKIKEAAENKTIGIVLCKNKKESIVKFTLPKDNKQIFTSKYKTYLPAKEELQMLMEPGESYYPGIK
ncbi:MAG: PDDEXK nuclease domain-containing protein [Bacteroidota bacterium]